MFLIFSSTIRSYLRDPHIDITMNEYIDLQLRMVAHSANSLCRSIIIYCSILNNRQDMYFNEKWESREVSLTFG